MAAARGEGGRIVVGLDVGTSKICAVVGEIAEAGVHVIGIGTHPSQGLRKGVVVNIEATVASIKRAVEEAELMAGVDISHVYVGIAGGHIHSLNSPGVIAVKGREVDDEDVARVIEAAKAVAIPTDREVIHTLPQEFVVDDQGGILDPRGMTGVRLEAKVHIITAATSAMQNLVKCCNRAGLDVLGVTLESLASAEAVLSQDEKDLGAILIDFGGGTTDTAVFAGGAIRHTSVLPLGGFNLTKDIAIGLRTPDSAAEKIKRRHGVCLVSRVGRDDTIEVEQTGGRKPRVMARQILAEIIEARVEEIFSLTDNEIARHGLKEKASSGLVLTGGSSMIEGAVELAEQVFNLPTRIGLPVGVSGLTDVIASPAYSTAVGLVLHGARQEDGGGRTRRVKETPQSLNRLLAKFRDWLKEAF